MGTQRLRAKIDRLGGPEAMVVERVVDAELVDIESTGCSNVTDETRPCVSTTVATVVRLEWQTCGFAWSIDVQAKGDPAGLYAIEADGTLLKVARIPRDDRAED